MDIQRADGIGTFKTPTLREIAGTDTYMHDGRFKTLEDMVKCYTQGGHQEPASGQHDHSTRTDRAGTTGCRGLIEIAERRRLAAGYGPEDIPEVILGVRPFRKGLAMLHR